VISGDGHPAAAPRALSWHALIPARGQWLVTVEAVPVHNGIPMRLHHPWGQPVENAVPARRLRQWRHGAPRVTTPDPDLAAVLHRSVEDIGALRIFDPAHPDRPVVAAGAPWFMARRPLRLPPARIVLRFPRRDHLAPIPYPTSCSPQAWVAAAPLQMLFTLLRIAPEPGSARLRCARPPPAVTFRSRWQPRHRRPPART